jgi:hypothetical protein
VKITKEILDSLRNLLGKLSGDVKKESGDFNDPKNQYRSYPPLKVRKPEENTHQPPPQILGVRGKKSNSISGDKAGGDKIKGGFEAGGKSPIA